MGIVVWCKFQDRNHSAACMELHPLPSLHPYAWQAPVVAQHCFVAIFCGSFVTLHATPGTGSVEEAGCKRPAVHAFSRPPRPNGHSSSVGSDQSGGFVATSALPLSASPFLDDERYFGPTGHENQKLHFTGFEGGPFIRAASDGTIGGFGGGMHGMQKCSSQGMVPPSREAGGAGLFDAELRELASLIDPPQPSAMPAWPRRSHPAGLPPTAPVDRHRFREALDPLDWPTSAPNVHRLWRQDSAFGHGSPCSRVVSAGNTSSAVTAFSTGQAVSGGARSLGAGVYGTDLAQALSSVAGRTHSSGMPPRPPHHRAPLATHQHQV
jgi:hypothetical protein